MRAKPGDRLRVKGNHVGQPDRCGEVVEVKGEDGGPPFLVRWDDSDHAVLFFPGGDAAVEHLAEH